MEEWNSIKKSYIYTKIMKKYLFIITIIAWLGFLLSACSTQSEVMNTKELETLINQNLKPGDSSEKIEAFLKEQKWPFAYDRFSSRYSTRYPEGDLDNAFIKKGIAIWIYVDESKAFARAEVEEVYTGL